MLIKTVINYINKHKLVESYDTIIIGLSGGPDSICLLHILLQIKDQFNLTLIIAHLDHEWRQNSQEDTLFCKQIAEQFDLKFVTKKASQIILTRKRCGGSSKEELGRLLRRKFFADTLKQENASSVALGHNWNDQEETFFIRLIRGSSIAGLAAMSPKNNYYIRPLLETSKSEILNYIQENNLSYLTDITNDFDTFLRNRIRKYVIPALKSSDNRFDKNFKKTLVNIQETNNFLNRLTDKIFKDITQTTQVNNSSTLWLDIEKFLNLDPYLYPFVLVKWICHYKVIFYPSQAIFNEIIRFLKQKNGSKKHSINPTWSLFKSTLNHKQFVSIKINY